MIFPDGTEKRLTEEGYVLEKHLFERWITDEAVSAGATLNLGHKLLSRRLLLKLNRPESFLNRAIDTESSSGKVCVPEEIRSSKLYTYVIGKRTPAFQERLGLIEESGEALPRKWSPSVPEL